MCCAKKLLSPKVCIILAVIGIIITFSITYPLARMEHHSCDSALNYFLSSSIAYPPESMIGAFGIAISSIPLLQFFYLRYTFAKMVIPRFRRCGRTNMNEVLFWIGSLGAMGIIGVGSFQCVQIVWAHYMFAGIAFLSFNLYIIGQTWYIDRLCKKHEPKYRRPVLRQIFAALNTLALIFMVVATFVDLPQLVQSFFEVMGFLTWEAWILTFYISFGPVIYYKLVPVTSADAIVRQSPEDDGLF